MVLVIALVAVSALVVIALLALMMGGNRYPSSIANGSRVTPSSSSDVVFVRQRDVDAVRCTAVATGSDRIILPRFDSWPSSVGGSRGGGGYKAVAVLPVDRGPLTITCTGIGGSDDIYVGKAPSLLPSMALFAIPLLVAAVIGAIAMIMRRRMRQQNHSRAYPHPAWPER